jgi:hypothetical protein
LELIKQVTELKEKWDNKIMIMKINKPAAIYGNANLTNHVVYFKTSISNDYDFNLVWIRVTISSCNQ